MPRVLLGVLLAASLRGQTNEIRLTQVVTGIFAPTDIQNAGDGSGRLFVVSQSGVIHLFKNGALAPDPFLDISTKTKGMGECGLLGLAFPPGFAVKRHFYVNYTDPACQNTIVARYQVSGNLDIANAASEQIVLTQSQPFANHNGGQLAFGPDGFLYIAFGDGGGAGDAGNFAQNRLSRLGKILRIDSESSSTFVVPPGNPFATDSAYLPEIWALGLRNPWRISFDRLTGDLWIADVGQGRAEEINFQPATSTGGENYGWRLKEGFACFNPATNCEQPGLTSPIHEYTREVGTSVSGGYVYRGILNPALVGDYIYGDFTSGRIWAIRRNGLSFVNREMLNPDLLISTFGQDEQGELYVGSYVEGTIYRIDPAAGATGPTILDPSPGLSIGVSGVTFRWTAVPGVTGYNLRITKAGAIIFQGDLTGAATLSTLISLDDGDYHFHVRGCTGGFADAQCGAFSTVAFRVQLNRPAAAPVITAPLNNQAFTSSTQQFAWTAIAGVSRYEILLRDMATGGQTVLSTSNAGSPPSTSTIFSMGSSTNYRLEVRACTSACGSWSAPVNFSVAVPPVPSIAPNVPHCALNGGNIVQCSWNAIPGADLYILEGVNPSAGPGGGALTVAAARVTQTSATVSAPAGPTAWIVRACNGNGCGPPSIATVLNPLGPNPAAPQLGSPVGGVVVDGPVVLFSWSRIPGDNGANTVYRLFVQDFARSATAADVLTTANFWALKFRGGGNRYDAQVTANPGSPGAITGPATAFIVKGSSPASPTMAAPRHQTPEVTQSIAAGNLLLAWTPVTGATVYEYFVAVQGQPQATVRGVTPGLFVQVPLSANATVYSGIVRACPPGPACVPGSDANWGPWSNAPGGAGVTNFLVQ